MMELYQPQTSINLTYGIVSASNVHQFDLMELYQPQTSINLTYTPIRFTMDGDLTNVTYVLYPFSIQPRNLALAFITLILLLDKIYLVRNNQTFACSQFLGLWLDTSVFISGYYTLLLRVTMNSVVFLVMDL